MKVIEFVANLKPIEYTFYVELVNCFAALPVAKQYREWRCQDGIVTNEGIEYFRSMVEELGVPAWILAALTDEQFCFLLTNFTLIVQEEVLRRETNFS